MNMIRYGHQMVITINPGDLSKKRTSEEHELELYFDLLNNPELDFIPAGDEQCASNLRMCYPIYDVYSNQIFFPTDKDCDDYRNGKAVRLYGRTPTKEELVNIDNGF